MEGMEMTQCQKKELPARAVDWYLDQGFDYEGVEYIYYQMYEEVRLKRKQAEEVKNGKEVDYKRSPRENERARNQWVSEKLMDRGDVALAMMLKFHWLNYFH